jgi:hypothetical protein
MVDNIIMILRIVNEKNAHLVQSLERKTISVLGTKNSFFRIKSDLDSDPAS